jgi:Fur family ferric uptake transcriptional regulator
MNADAKPNLEVLREYVARHGLKLTRQRELIAEVFFNAGGHLGAEELLDRVRKEQPHVSLATIYRTMKLLTECGLASSHRFDDRQTVYEPSDGNEEHHDHLICTDCGKITEFCDPRIEQLQDKVAAQHGFVVNHHRMELFASCLDQNCPNRPRG